mgnify:CR=1 FL=1
MGSWNLRWSIRDELDDGFDGIPSLLKAVRRSRKETGSFRRIELRPPFLYVSILSTGLSILLLYATMLSIGHDGVSILSMGLSISLMYVSILPIELMEC